MEHTRLLDYSKKVKRVQDTRPQNKVYGKLINTSINYLFTPLPVRDRLRHSLFCWLL